MRDLISCKKGISDKPFTIKIELVKGCTRRCSFCAIDSIIPIEKQGTFEFISLDIIEKISKECNKWLGSYRVEMAMRGEPLMHPKILDVIKTLKTYSPKVHILLFSNGDPILKNNKWDFKRIKDLFDAGLNVLVLDNYDINRIKLSKQLINNKILKGITITHDGNCFNYKANRKEINITGITALGKQNIRQYHNFGGNLSKDKCKNINVIYPEQPLEQNCVKPFRELVILSNGVSNLCCNDWGEDIKLGRFPDKSLKEMYYSRKADIIRELLIRKKRLFKPCSNCSYSGGYRKGLIAKPNLSDKTEDLLKELSTL